MTEKERMIAGLIYSDGDDELQNAMAQCKKKLYEYNNMPDATREERGEGSATGHILSRRSTAITARTFCSATRSTQTTISTFSTVPE